MSKAVTWFMLLFVPCPVLAAGFVGPRLAARVAATPPAGMVEVVVRLADPTPGARAGTGLRVADRQRRKADRSVAGVAPGLARVAGGQAVARSRRLWIVNALALRLPAGAVARLATVPGVASVFLDETIHLDRVLPAATCDNFDPGWNVTEVGAPTAWDNGYRGQGVVVGVIDSGVDGDHPDLSAGWRGGTNSWFDAFGQFSVPTDDDPGAHGTGVTGIVVGGDNGGFPVGVAPDAQWIAARAFQNTPSGASSTVSQLLAALQWMADPDEDPSTDDAPRVVNGSWSINGPGAFTESPSGIAIREAVTLLRRGGTLPVFAGGNSGNGSENTSESPANYPEAFAVGAHDPDEAVLFDSGRGPSAHDGFSLYPDLVAPGDCVTTADKDLGVGAPYALRVGTSFAAPHVAGAAALLWSADPALTVDQVELELETAATFVPGQLAPDTAAGYGRLDLAVSPVIQPLPGGALPAVALTSDAGVAVAAGDPVTITATPAATGVFEYRFWLAGPGGDGAARVGRDFAADPRWVWVPNSADTGTTRVVVQGRSAGSPLAYEARSSTDVTVVDPDLTVGVEVSPSVGVSLGQTVTFTASGVGGSGRYEYRFVLDGPGTGGLETVSREFSSQATWAWFPDASDVGDTRVVVELRNQGSKGAVAETTVETTVTVVDLGDALDQAARDAGLDLPDRGLCFLSVAGAPSRGGPARSPGCVWVEVVVLLFLGGVWLFFGWVRKRVGVSVAVLLLLAAGSARADGGRWDLQLSLGAFRAVEDTWQDQYDSRTRFDLRGGLGVKVFDQLEVGLEVGYRRATGDRTVSVDTGTGTVTDSFGLELVVVPVHAFVLIPFRFQPSQLFVPYVGVGVGPTYYRQKIERGDDVTGYLWGVRGRVGCRLCLDRLDPATARAARGSLGLEHSYLFFEGLYGRADDLGGHGADLGGVGLYTGVSLEF